MSTLILFILYHIGAIYFILDAYWDRKFEKGCSDADDVHSWAAYLFVGVFWPIIAMCIVFDRIGVIRDQ